MDLRKKQYVRSLGLIPFHKEGGYFKETIRRPPDKVPTQERGGGERNIYTTIYHMMTPESVSYTHLTLPTKLEV